MIDQQQGNAIPLTVTTTTEQEMPPKDNCTMIVYNDSHSEPLLTPPDVVMPLEDLCVMPPPPPPPSTILETPYHNVIDQGTNDIHHNNKTESPRKRPRKSVSFAVPEPYSSSSNADDGGSYFDVATQVHEIPHYDYYTQEEYESIYLTRVDYARIRKENLVILKLMMKDIYPSTSKYYFRGLETHIPQTKKERLRKTKSAVNAILKQQKTLRDGNSGSSVVIPSHWIDTFYVDKYSSSSAEDAYMVAMFDHATLTMEDEDEIDEYGDVILDYGDVEESTSTSSSSESIDDYSNSSSTSESITDEDYSDNDDGISA